MNSNFDNKCGCKGIRTCLMCESGMKTKSIELDKEILQYIYCSHCNLCWPASSHLPHQKEPLYLGKIKLITDFLTKEEESSTINEIDQIPWALSQSGRKKQDFGPKVNFKKRKAKVGNFKGFPQFTEKFVRRFPLYKDLEDFHPVELCHLDYSPERGSAIEPHIDDSWIWGERLITINLASTTILTLTVAKADDCSCFEQSAFKMATFPEGKCSFADWQQQEHLNCNGDVSDVPPHSVEDSCSVADLCSVYRSVAEEVQVEVQLVLPPRSMLVLGGCARHNWFHGIKRENIKCRRLAMTFRELAETFQPGGAEENLGHELMVLGTTFYDD